VARLTRHELKDDKFKSAYEEYMYFLEQHYREAAVAVGMALVIVGLVFGLRYLMAREEAVANAQLGEALDTFHAYVGAPAPGSPGPTFSTAKEKYTKALGEFTAMTELKGWAAILPTQRAVRIARYHVGLCQAELGDEAGAIKTLTQAADDRDAEIASLARFALAEQLVKTGKTADAIKLYQYLEDHPTTAVPKATAELAHADALRTTQPAEARRIYEHMQREYASDSTLAESVRQQIASLPK
jgi:tetratricopeptide (TPR) repeat protein